MIVMYCKQVLKRIDKISAVEAYVKDYERGKNRKYSFSLIKNQFFSTNIYMEITDVFKRFQIIQAYCSLSLLYVHLLSFFH